MARLSRFVLAGQPHHVVQRGHNQQPIVHDDEDRRMWLSVLQDAAVMHRVDVHGWVLLDTQFQLLATPASADALSRMMQALGRRYVAWFNRRHARSGTLWQGRFRASMIEPQRWFLTCLRHVELLPARAGPAVEPADHVWSSLAHHLGRRVDPLVSDHPAYWALGNTPFERHAAYRTLIEAGVPDPVVAEVEASTRRGWPLASPEFVAGLQTSTVRPLSPRPRGRPRKPALTF